MIAAVCIDDKNGLTFNHRRQSRDRMVCADLLREADGRPLWMNAYSAGLFRDAPFNLRTAEDFLDRAGPGELCFVENLDLTAWADKLEGLIVYRWNRVYPADFHFTLPLEGWTPARCQEFAGSSHEKITKEVYIR